MFALSQSTQFDWRLARYDLAGSRAHARALHRAELLTDDELAGMIEGLDRLEADVVSGAFGPAPTDEDVHGALERGLIERIGAELGGRLRAGRSRNDQIATLIRLYLRARAVRDVGAEVQAVIEALHDQARTHLGRRRCPAARTCSTPSPCSSATTCWRTRGRCCATSTGSATWTAGSPSARTVRPPWPAPRSGWIRRTSPRLLGFDSAVANSIDGTAARDLVAEACFVLAQIGVDLSRIGEEVILWSTHEFGFVRLADAWSTGSSIMPQKKNPDVAELARGKAGRLIGNLTGLLATLKGLPLAYNRDLQEDKEPVFDSVDQLLVLTPAVAGLIATLTFDTERLASLAPRGFSLATDVADWLVRQRVPFAEAHHIAGAAVQFCEASRARAVRPDAGAAGGDLAAAAARGARGAHRRRVDRQPGRPWGDGDRTGEGAAVGGSRSLRRRVRLARRRGWNR